MDRETTVVIDNRPSAHPHFPSFVRELHPSPIKRPGMEYRTSIRWFSEHQSIRKMFQIPFISKSGKFSINTLYFWKAYPEQIFFSVISTVYQRLLKIMTKRHSRINRRFRDAIIKIAIVYAIIKDDTIIDRFLGMTRRGGAPIKAISNYAHYCAVQLNEDKRFVYSQAFHQANWLKFQSRGISDKFSIKMCRSTHLRGLLLDGLVEQPSNIGQIYLDLIDFWVTCPVSVVSEAGSHYGASLSSGSVPFSSETLAWLDEGSEDDFF